jgi:urea carboxylase-associated protein 2
VTSLSPATIPADRLVHQEPLRGGSAWSRQLRRGQVLRLTDLTGKACVSALLYNARDPIERYNMPDTLKAQFTAFLTTGRVLYSDMGRVLMSIIGDTCGWHDTISGCGDAAASRARFGEGSYQERRNDFFRNARDNFLVELGKHGLGKRDLGANVNFFVRVTVDGEGRMSWTAGNSRPGAYVDLRCEMDTLVVLTNTPHPLDPATSYGPPAVDLAIWRGEAPTADDPCRLSRPENGRGFALTEAYLAEVGR